MPGGSGLLQQLIANLPRIVPVARELVGGCPAACDHSCIDCLQTFRNGFYHRYLNRHVARESLNTPEPFAHVLRRDNHDPFDMPIGGTWFPPALRATFSLGMGRIRFRTHELPNGRRRARVVDDRRSTILLTYPGRSPGSSQE